MSDDSQVALHLEFLPIADEESNFDTLVRTGQVCADIQHELQQQADLTVEPGSSGERGADILVLLSLTGEAVVTSQDLLMSFFNMVTETIELLARKDHVQEVEIIIGGTTIALCDLTKSNARDIIAILTARHVETEIDAIAQRAGKVRVMVSRQKRAGP